MKISIQNLKKVVSEALAEARGTCACGKPIQNWAGQKKCFGCNARDIEAAHNERVGKAGSPPVCPECGLKMIPADKEMYEARGGTGWPDICAGCAGEEV